jgi:5-enolpyruvylshikimate-3-phosphate synthase
MSPAQPASIQVPVRLQSEPRAGNPQTVGSESAPGAIASHNLGTHLSGDEEVPARATDAQGQATFQVSGDGSTISYKLIVANIENVTQAHIHLAPAGSNGGIVAWLYPAAPPSRLIPGRTQGILGEGEITAASLVGSLSGQPLSALLDAMRNGGAYVNVHTSQFPPGEIRGQVD